MEVLGFQVILTSFQPRRSQTVAGSLGRPELPFLGDPVQRLGRTAAEGLSWDSVQLGRRVVEGSACGRDQAAPGQPEAGLAERARGCLRLLCCFAREGETCSAAASFPPPFSFLSHF